ncbi:hypothetical protein ACJIZ3_002088 [Penstemon smallii]|uniref:Phytosulfokine n=1 Tax=Penstemon smallii TaxID=265156 RepID=A0ABD3U5U1_9LAMI
MSKTTTFLVIALLLCFSLCSASRPGPTFGHKLEPKHKVEAEGIIVQLVEDSCKGIGEDDCLMRRILTAHLDYIYTQHHKP